MRVLHAYNLHRGGGGADNATRATIRVLRQAGVEVETFERDSRSIGERNLIEGGAQVRFTGGARRFSASAEIYARRTRYAVLYVDDQIASPFTEALEPLDDTTVHGGGRFLFEAWVSPRLRMRAEYELTNRFASAPEIAGLKALRLVAEGHY